MRQRILLVLTLLFFAGDTTGQYKLLPATGQKLIQIPYSGGGSHGYDCDQTIDSYNGKISSPGFPRSYPPGKYCRYLIIRAGSDVCKFELLFKTFKVQYTPGCSADYVELPDRSTVCGQHVPIRTLEFPHGSRAVEVKFVSDYYDDDSDFRGFEIIVVQVPHSCRTPTYPYPGYPSYPTKSVVPRPTYVPGACDITNFQLESKFISPGYPYDYGPNQYCIFTLQRYSSDVCVVELQFRAFELEYSGPGCSKDYLELPDGVRLCGSQSGTRHLTFAPGAKSIHLKFVSDSYGQSRGFDIAVTQIPNSCPSYPSGFQEYDCCFIVERPQYPVYSRFPTPMFTPPVFNKFATNYRYQKSAYVE